MSQAETPPSPARAIVTGRGAHVPEATLSNADIASIVDAAKLREFVGTNVWCRNRFAALRANGSATAEVGALSRRVYAEFVEERVGIASRHVIDGGLPRGLHPARDTHASDLGIEAAKRALLDAGTSAADLDAVVCGTSTPDSLCPGTAVRIQRALGAEHAYAFDLMAACSSFVYALNVAGSLVRSGSARRVLVVSAEYFSAMADWSDPTNAYFAGDGAAAVVVEAEEPTGARHGLALVDAVCRSRHAETIRTGMGGTRQMLASRGSPGRSPLPGDDAFPYFHQDGPQVYRDVLPEVEAAVRALLRRARLSPSEVRRWWVHQASLPIIDGIFSRLLGGRPPESILPLPLRSTGNMSSCGAAYAFATDRPLPIGEAGVLLAFGGGYTVGAMLVRGG